MIAQKDSQTAVRSDVAAAQRRLAKTIGRRFLLFGQQDFHRMRLEILGIDQPHRKTGERTPTTSRIETLLAKDGV